MLYLANLFRSNLLEVREIETQRIRSYERTLLLYMRTKHTAQSFVQQVSTRVVGSTSIAFVRIHTSHHRSLRMFRQFLCDMYRKIVFLLSVDNVDSFELAYQYTGVAHLTTTFRIERSIAQYYLIQSLILLLNLTVTEYGCFIFSIVISNECSFAFFQGNPVACFYSRSVTGTCFLFFHFCLETLYIGSKTILAKNKFCKVERESESVVQRERVHTADFCFAGCFSFIHCLVKKADTGFESTQE